MAPANVSDSIQVLALIRALLSPSRDLRGGLAAVAPAGVAALMASGEWRVFAPLVYCRLQKKGGRELLSTEQWALVRGEAARAVALAMTRERLCVLIAERLRPAGIQVMLLKAAALSGWVYPAEAPRLGVDLDLLVRPQEADRFAEALAGIVEERDKFPGKPHLARLAYERSFWTKGPVPTELDVHFALAYPALYPVDYRAMWERSHPHPAYGREQLLVPSAEDMLLHMALHSLYDLRGWSRHDVDALLLISGGCVVWDAVVRRAQEWGAGSAAFFLLSRIREDLGASVPDWVLRRIRPGLLRRGVGRWVLGATTSVTGGPGPLGWRVRQLAAQQALSKSPLSATGFQIRYLGARVLDALTSTPTGSGSQSADRR